MICYGALEMNMPVLQGPGQRSWPAGLVGQAGPAYDVEIITLLVQKT